MVTAIRKFEFLSKEKKVKKNSKTVVAATVAIATVCASAGSSIAGSHPGGKLHDLEELVQRQQQQLDSQAGEIAALKEQLKTLLGTTEQNKEALTTKADKEEIKNLPLNKMVASKNANVDVSLYGQINRAALWADNGDSGKVYFVDNSSFGVDGCKDKSSQLTKTIAF